MRIALLTLLAFTCVACSKSHESPWLTGDPMSAEGGPSEDASVDVSSDTSMDSDPGGNDATPDAAPDVSMDAAPDASMDTTPEAEPDTPPDVPPPIDACADNIAVACDGVDDDCDGDSDEGMCAPPPGTGTGLSFEPGDYVELSGSGLDLGTGAFTLEVWYTPASSTSGSVFGNRPNAPSPGLLCAIQPEGAMVEPLMTIDALTLRLPSVAPNSAMYTALARDSVGNLAFGTSGGSASAGTNRRESVTNGAWRLGQTGVGDPGFTGVITRARIWSIARPIAALTSTSADATDTTGLVAEFNFSEGAGQTITSTFGDVTGQLGSTTGEDASDPMWVFE